MISPGRWGWAMPLALAAIAGALGGDALPWSPWFAALGMLLAVALVAWRRSLGLGLCLLAFAWCAGSIHQQRLGVLPASLAGSDFALSGRIQALDIDPRRSRFELSVERCEPLEKAARCPDLARVRLSWYGAPVLTGGERWALTARLRQPLGFANPDTFDYDAWLWREGIQALGYVRDGPATRLASAPFSLRRAALERLEEVPLSARGKRWLAALTLGAGDRLEAADWELLNATGTTHLMVISGLHVGLVSMLVLWLLRRASRLLQPRAWRMTLWPWFGAGMAAFAYAALAGFGPPAMRAAIMVSVGLWAASGRHAPGWWQAWWLALALVVICDPLAPWRPGVWLSFTAVAVLILAWSGRPQPRGWRGWCLALLRSQWLLAPVMAAAVLLAFGRLAPVAPLINLLAVPLVGSIMVPLGFAGWMLIAWPALAAWAWWPFDRFADALAAGLKAAAEWLPLWMPDPWWQWPLALALLLWSALWLLPGIERLTRIWGSVGIVALIAAVRPPTLAQGELIATVYDVGQGQLVELETRSQRVLVDTGPRFSSGFMPAALLWPAGRHFDAVIVTHSDIDHAGGVAELLEHHRVERWWAPRGNTLGLPSRPCQAGAGWRAGEARWQFLSPPPDSEKLSRNDRSCVLLVTLGERRVLITGDAGSERERQFVNELPPGSIDLLVAGHHGSATSSSPELVAAARPHDVIFSSGRGNPFGHPAPRVVERFLEAGSRIWNTAFDGAVRVRLTPETLTVQTQRHPGWSRRAAVEERDVGVESSP